MPMYVANPGPNSNTFARQLLESGDYFGIFPLTAVGAYYYSAETP